MNPRKTLTKEKALALFDEMLDIAWPEIEIVEEIYYVSFVLKKINPKQYKYHFKDWLHNENISLV